jgi:hypothetical protein
MVLLFLINLIVSIAHIVESFKLVEEINLLAQRW